MKIAKQLGESLEKPENHNIDEIEEMMDEDLKMFEEMNRKVNQNKAIED